MSDPRAPSPGTASVKRRKVLHGVKKLELLDRDPFGLPESGAAA